MTDRSAAGGRRALFGGRRPYMLAIVAAIIVFILVAPVRVHGDNMSPRLNDGDVVIILKSSYYDAKLPEYGDVLCFRRSFASESARAASGFDERSYRFARVAGLPGDEMELRGDGVYRNGKRLSGSDFAGVKGSDEDAGVRKVGSGEVFVLNDDSPNAMDSRDDGTDTLLDEARGKVVFRVWPIGGFGTVN
jgi:signal peptidase I